MCSTVEISVLQGGEDVNASCFKRRTQAGNQAMVSTTPPSTRSAAPVVAEACGEAA